jgi:peptide/nickel transport system substrate-binding protein
MTSNQVSRRAAIALIGGLIASVGVSASCSSGIKPAVAVPTQASVGGALVFGVVQPIASIAAYPFGPTAVSFRRAMWDTLVSLDAQRQPVPELAESWSMSDDRRTITFQLRQGVTFHSGRPFTVQDAQWNFEYAQDPKTQAAAGEALRGARITAVDNTNLQLVLPEPLPQLFSALAGAPILDPQSDLARSPGGTGPFKLESFDPGNELRLVRLSGYWRPGLPHLERLTIRIIPDPSALLVNLESGAINLAYPVSLNEVKRLQSGGQTMVVLNPMAGNQAYLLRVDDGPFADKRVRQALAMAMDRQRCVDSVLYGLGTPASVVWPKASPAWDAALDTIDFDLDRAHQLLAEAGRDGGFDTSITASRTFTPDMFAFHLILQADLAKIAIKAKLNVVDENVRAKMLVDSNFSGLIHYGAGGADLDPAGLFDGSALRPHGNPSHFESAEYNRLIDAGRRELDNNKRLAIYHQITQLLKDEAFFLPVANPMIAHGLRRDVQGLGFTVGLPAAPVFTNVAVG